MRWRASVAKYPTTLSPGSEESVLCDLVSKLDGRNAVYFVGCLTYVKIGYTSTPYVRFESLNCIMAPIDILLLIPGGRSVERNLHDRFREYHSHAEWFRNEGKLATYIGRMRNKAGIVETETP